MYSTVISPLFSSRAALTMEGFICFWHALPGAPSKRKVRKWGPPARKTRGRPQATAAQRLNRPALPQLGEPVKRPPQPFRANVLGIEGGYRGRGVPK